MRLSATKRRMWRTESPSCSARVTMSMSSGTAAGMSSSKNVWLVVSGARGARIAPSLRAVPRLGAAGPSWPFTYWGGGGDVSGRQPSRPHGDLGSPIGCALASWLWRAAGAGASACPRGPRPDQERGVPALPRAGPKSSPLRTRASPARQHRATRATSSDAPCRGPGRQRQQRTRARGQHRRCVAPQVIITSGRRQDSGMCNVTVSPLLTVSDQT
jgi:hypothetical protein